MELTKEQVERIISSLEMMKERGEFEGFPEENMNFSDLTNDELTYYSEEWLPLELTLTAIETAASNFLEEHNLHHGNAEYYTDFLTLTVVVEAPNNWTIGLEVDIEDIETVEELNKAIEHEYLREIEYTSVDEYFSEIYDNVSSQFTPSEFLQMLNEDMDHFQSVVNKINGVEENIITGDLSTIVYNLEQMDFTAEDILYRLEEALKGYTFELDTENGDTITLKERN